MGAYDPVPNRAAQTRKSAPQSYDTYSNLIHGDMYENYPKRTNLNPNVDHPALYDAEGPVLRVYVPRSGRK